MNNSWKHLVAQYRLCCEHQGGHVEEYCFFINRKLSYTFVESFNKIQRIFFVYDVLFLCNFRQIIL